MGTVELRYLLTQLKKSTEFFLLTDSISVVLDSVVASCVQILLHGLTTQQVAGGGDVVVTLTTAAPATSFLSKLMEDFEWVQRSTQIRDAPHPPTDSKSTLSAEHFLHSWTTRNLRARCLCACLEAFISDTELLQCHYKEYAFLRSEPHAMALCICISALELDQCSLLSQIPVDLYTTSLGNGSFGGGGGGARHKRSSSHPNFSISTLKETTPPPPPLPKSQQAREVIKPTAPTVLPTFRKTKSLPIMPLFSDEKHPKEAASKTRPRSKTVSSATQRKSLPKTPLLGQKQQQQQISNLDIKLSAVTPPPPNTTRPTMLHDNYSDDDMQRPSTSAGSRKSHTSNLTINSSHSSTSTVASSGSSSTNSTTAARRIELIKCDNIKIWTDQSWEARQAKQNASTQAQTAACAIPQHSLPVKQVKSTSPINSFISSLFGTSPTYTSWSLTCQNSDAAADTSAIATAGIYPCLAAAPENSPGGVFDAFLPVYGKKLRSRKSQNLFEDGISSLDYSAAAANELTAAQLDNEGSSSSKHEVSSTTPVVPPLHNPNSESLTAFLQMAQLSRNNTELEKENAHFRISEAIISAIEHIKWSKLEPDKWRRQNETSVATDWLEKDDHHKSCLKNDSETPLTAAAEEYIPYAEVGESCLDLLSAEVVGLSLISKFNDKHLPKMSELKWLVSEADAPQKLLPMPDNSATTANSDEQVTTPSVTRGTNYWAPPRQQIIFTDHPPPNRKELIKKQNNRCAGCGMRVSPQFVHSFRYCMYLGKYHCTGCHRNQISATPAKILHMWDFNCYPVSVFAYRLLEQMYAYPLFYVPDLNPALYVRQKTLLTTRNKRAQLKFVKDFIRMCRFACREQSYFASIPDYITGDPDTWSMSDFIDVSNKSMQRSIDELIESCENHIFNCVLCTARGFRCEYCLKDQVIYPWQNKIFRCDRCGTCVHQNCWKLMCGQCSRCQRMNKRQIVDLI